MATNGVPPLLDPTTAPSASPSVVTLDTVQVTGQDQGGPQWGIFKAGTFVLAIRADSVDSLEMRKEFRIADYPLEDGAFETYNKVEMPFETRVQLTRSGNIKARQEFIDDLDTASKTLMLVDVITPDKKYYNACITHYDYRRTATNGAGLVIAEVGIQEVRIAVAPAFSNVKQQGSADTVSAGSVQAAPATPAQTSAVNTGRVSGSS